MSIRESNQNILIPYFNLAANGTIDFLSSAYTIDAASEKVATIMKIGKSGNLSRVLFRTASMTSGSTLTVSLQTVDTATGMPTGTLYHANATGTVAVSVANTQYAVTFTAFPVTIGDVVALVVEQPAAGAGNCVIARPSWMPTMDFPYGAIFTSSWAKAAVAAPISILEYDDGSTAPTYTSPVNASTTFAFNSGTNPNHRGNRFSLPYPMTVVGLWAFVDSDGDYDLILAADNWDGTNGNALGRISMSASVRRTTANGVHVLTLSAPVNLLPNAVYRVIVKPTTVTSLNLISLDVSDADHWDTQGDGLSFIGTSANNPTGSGSWTDLNTRKHACGIIVDGFDGGGSRGYAF